MLGDVMDDVVEPAPEDFQLPRILAALAEPSRLAAAAFVARNGESWCAQVMEQAMLPMTKSTFSHHLRILREAGRVNGAQRRSTAARARRRARLDATLPISSGSRGHSPAAMARSIRPRASASVIISKIIP